MNNFRSIIEMERHRTGYYGADCEPNENQPCPVCSSVSWDYLLMDKDGDLVGCDDCLKRIYS